MTIKFYTIQNPPTGLAEEATKLPSETRQSDTMDIKETIARFFREGGTIPQQQGASDLTADEKEQLFDAPSEIELEDADISEQTQYVSDVLNALNQSQQEQNVTEKEDVKEDNSAKKETPSDSAKAE